MQAQEVNTTPTDYLFRLLPWFEANLKRLAYGAAFVLIAIFIYCFYSYRQNQQELTASQELTLAILSHDGGPRAAACLKIASEYSSTLAGQRALLEGATALFTSGQYADAQNAFQKYLDMYPDTFLAPQAQLGVAASLDALAKTDLAYAAYQKAAGQTANQSVAISAKFSMARLDEAGGKFADAARLYNEVMRADGNSSLGSEASLRLMDLKTKLPAAPAVPARATPVPFNLSK